MHPKRYGSGFAKELHLYQLFAFDINSVGFPLWTRVKFDQINPHPIWDLIVVSQVILSTKVPRSA